MFWDGSNMVTPKNVITPTRDYCNCLFRWQILRGVLSWILIHLHFFIDDDSRIHWPVVVFPRHFICFTRARLGPSISSLALGVIGQPCLEKPKPLVYPQVPGHGKRWAGRKSFLKLMLPCCWLKELTCFLECQPISLGFVPLVKGWMHGQRAM
jgi:hypothetical protein